MDMQILLSTMNQNPNIVKTMNIRTDAVIVNQCVKNEAKILNCEDKKIEFYSFHERGIGRSRNNALMRASADICLFADDDVVYCDDYEQMIKQEFERCQDADVILFNVVNINASRPESPIKKFHRVHKYNCLRYGTYQMAVKRERIWHKNIWFSLLFGGGTQYSYGEDSIFLWDCLTKHLHVYAIPTTIGTVSHKESTWFHGFNEKYFIDSGRFYYTLSPKLSYIFCIQFLVKNKILYVNQISMRKAYILMLQGIGLMRKVIKNR